MSILHLAEYLLMGLGIVGVVIVLLHIVCAVLVSGHESDLEHSRKWRAF